MLSRILYILCSALILLTSFVFYPRWQQKTGEALLSWDASGYYWYLPATFIYHDLKYQSFNDHLMHQYEPTPGNYEQGIKQPDGGYVLKYSSGMAVMEMPFFFAGHLLAKPLGYPADGLSPPYQLAIQLGGVLFALLGLWYFRRFLLLFYNDRVVAVTLLLLTFGTNYLNYAAIDVGMSHSWLFTVYVFILLNTYRFYQQPRMRYAIRLGLLTGLATLTRPTDIIACLIPLLWGLESVSAKAVKERISFFSRHYRLLLAAVAAAAMVIAIQPIYWKTVSGHWLVYSYGDQHFSWLHPHVYRYAFDAWNGWLAYTPLMILAFIGILPYLKHGRNKVMVLVFFTTCYYIVSAWDIWWYGGRAMVQYYPVLFLPVACLLHWLGNTRIWKWTLSPFILLLAYINIWWTYQAHAGKFYDGSEVTGAYYWHTIGRFSAPENIAKLKDTDQWYGGVPKHMKLLYRNDFEQDTVYRRSPVIIAGQGSVFLDSRQKIYQQAFCWNGGPYTWLRVSGSFHCFQKEWDVWRMAQLSVQFKQGNDVVSDHFIRLHRLINNGETREIFLDIKIPERRADSVIVTINNSFGKEQLAFDNLEISGFK